jgi:hypothetical protein
MLAASVLDKDCNDMTESNRMRQRRHYLKNI